MKKYEDIKEMGYMSSALGSTEDKLDLVCSDWIWEWEPPDQNIYCTEYGRSAYCKTNNFNK